MYSAYYPAGSYSQKQLQHYAIPPAYPVYPNTAYPAGYRSMNAPPPPPPYLQPALQPVAPVSSQDPVVGGISAVLEYEPSRMAAFITWVALSTFGQSRSPLKSLESSVTAILHATRLPKSTILIALEYINQRFGSAPLETLPDKTAFLRIVVALGLANKFNDDNTFTNRSWCGASALNIDVLNKEEAAWLAAVNWKLSVVNLRPNIEVLDECWSSWSTNSMRNVPLQYSSPVPSTGCFSSYSPVPSSPLYELPAPPVRYASPISPTPLKYLADWAMYQDRGVDYQPRCPSIWAYPAPAFQPVPVPMDAGFPAYAPAPSYMVYYNNGSSHGSTHGYNSTNNYYKNNYNSLAMC